MNDLQVFKNAEFGEIRTVTIDDEPWFVAKDVAMALGYTNTKQAIKVNVSEEDRKHLPKSDFGGSKSNTSKINNNGAMVINESGLYSLILSSKLPTAKKFKHWVTSEVLPSIRKNNGYIMNQENMTPEQIMAEGILIAQRIIESKNKEIERMKPKEVFADAVKTSHTSILVGDLAKILKQNGIETGPKRLFEWLRNNGYLIKRNGTDRNMPTQRAMEMGLFEVKESTINNPDGSVIITKTTKVTGKGQLHIINKFLGERSDSDD